VRVSLPPYLNDGTPTDANSGSRLEPLRPGGRRTGLLLALTAVLSAAAGASLTSFLDSDVSPSSSTADTRIHRRLAEPFGPSQSFGNWKVALDRWQTTPARDFGRNTVHVTITNASDQVRTWITDEQVALRYAVPLQRASVLVTPSPDDVFWYVRSPDSGSGRVDVDSRASFEADYSWELPPCARDVVLKIRGPADEGDLTEIFFGRPSIAAPTVGPPFACA
jgi:hypothetical protein